MCWLRVDFDFHSLAKMDASADFNLSATSSTYSRDTECTFSPNLLSSYFKNQIIFSVVILCRLTFFYRLILQQLFFHVPCTLTLSKSWLHDVKAIEWRHHWHLDWLLTNLAFGLQFCLPRNHGKGRLTGSPAKHHFYLLFMTPLYARWMNRLTVDPVLLVVATLRKMERIQLSSRQQHRQ